MFYSVVAAGYSKLSDARTSMQDVAAVNVYATGVFVAAILLVILLLFGGICGVAGSIQQKPNTYCLLFYAIISLICSIWFLAIAIAALKGPDAYFSGSCTSVEYFGKLENYTTAAANSGGNGICQTNCQCYFPKISDSTVYSGPRTMSITQKWPLLRHRLLTQVHQIQPKLTLKAALSGTLLPWLVLTVSWTTYNVSSVAACGVLIRQMTYSSTDFRTSMPVLVKLFRNSKWILLRNIEDCSVGLLSDCLRHRFHYVWNCDRSLHIWTVSKEAGQRASWNGWQHRWTFPDEIGKLLINITNFFRLNCSAI